MGARGAVAGVVVLGLVVGGAYAADRYAHAQAESQLAAAIEQRVQVDGAPDVRVEGFPFLTQYLAGSLDDVRATAAGVVLDGLTVTDVDVVLHDVAVPAPYRAGDVRVEATVPTSSVEQAVAERAALDLTVDGDLLRAGGELLGIPLTAGLAPRVQDGELLVDVQDVSVGGGTLELDRLPGRIAERLAGLRVPLEGLPEGIVLQQATVVPDGVRFTATGADVVLEQLS